MKIRKTLTPQAIVIIRDKATEPPFSSPYDHPEMAGSYLCRQCGQALFRATNQFSASCGWPSFDEEIAHAIQQQPDPDGQRIEILCSICQAHLGHIFYGEGYTKKNTRYCVNGLSLDFVTSTAIQRSEEAIFAAGCFWGVEYCFQQLKGIVKTEVGYCGGHQTYPTYQAVCEGDTGHWEAIRVLYDPSLIDYQQVVHYFFEIHDPTQTNGQGPDIGPQYGSAIFGDETQRQVAQTIIAKLVQQGYAIATQLLPESTFWPAEAYHQNYYMKKGTTPYCHHYVKRFF